MQRFTDLRVWRECHTLTLAVYRCSAGFPQTERYGLTSQLRRAAVSAGCNIAEGSKRRTAREYARFLNIAEGSMAEAEYLMMVARDLSYVPEAQARTLMAAARDAARMLHGLRRAVERARSTSNVRRSTVDG